MNPAVEGRPSHAHARPQRCSVPDYSDCDRRTCMEGASFGKDPYAWEDDAERTEVEEAPQFDDAVKSKAFQIYMREGASFGKDPYAWEDYEQRTEGEEAPQFDDAEDDAPLSSFIDPGLVDRRIRRGLILNAKNAGGMINTTPGTATSVRKEVSVSAEAQPTSAAGSSYTPWDKSTPVKRRGSIFKKDKLKGLHVLGRFKESSEPKTKKSRVLPKVTRFEAREENEGQEFGHSKRIPASNTEDQSRGDVTAYAEQSLVSNAARVAGFHNARTAINNLLVAEFPSWYPVSEAACAEVEFAQELEAAAASDLRKVCEEIQPAVKAYYRREESASDYVAPLRNAEEKWMEARCKHLRSSLNFHYSIIRHLSGPTFALCSTKETATSS